MAFLFFCRGDEEKGLLNDKNYKKTLITSHLISSAVWASVVAVVGISLYIQGNKDGFHNGLIFGCEEGLNAANSELETFYAALPAYLRHLLPNLSPEEICTKIADIVTEASFSVK